MKYYTPDRGDIIWLDFTPQTGHEQAGKRPAIVLSSKSYNAKTSLMLVCPITSKVKGYPFEVEVKTSKITGVTLADQVRNLDWRARKATFVTKADASTLRQIIKLISRLMA